MLSFAPESLWHFVRANKSEEAENSVIRLGSSAQKKSAKAIVAMTVHTNELEKSVDEGTSYWDCFKGIDRQSTEIVCIAFAAQPFCGSAMAGTPMYFLSRQVCHQQFLSK